MLPFENSNSLEDKFKDFIRLDNELDEVSLQKFF